MFGSISNWVNENKPSMPSIPTIPTVNMPNVSMPNVSMPGFLNKNKENTDENPVEEPNVEKDTNEQTEPITTDEVKVENIEENNETGEATEIKNPSETPSTPEEEAAKGAGYNLGAAREMGSNIGSMLFSFGSKATSNVRNATTSLKDVIQKKTIIGEFNKENEKFINEKKNKERKEDAAVPPWVGYNEEEKLKEQILALSSDSRNFLRAPPSGVDFNFNFNTSYPIAMALLEEDPALSEMRFKLVPKQVKEENFWLNYFYRVSLIKQSTTLDELAKQNVDASNDTKTTKSSNQSTKQDTIEFVSDTYDENINDEEIKKELKQLNLDSKKLEDDLDDAEWDIKPEDVENISPEEIEKEINSMLN